MIARIWKGEVALDRSEEYLEPMQAVRTLIPGRRLVVGQRNRPHPLHGDRSEFLMLTFWESRDAIRAFNGDDISVAKYYDFDAEVLLEMVPHTDHYEMYVD